MDDREWMYIGFECKSPEWVRGTNAFLEHAFGPIAKGSSRMPCPCSKCKNKKKKRKREMYRDIFKNGFVPNYTCWNHHGERARMRDEASQSHAGQQVNEFTGYALAHKGKATAVDNVYNPQDGPNAYTNESAYSKLTEYTTAARQRHGEEFDPTTEPLDTDLLMRLGGGKQHGRYWMANSAIESSSVPTLSEVRVRSTSSSDIPIAPRQPSNTQVLAAMQAQLAALQAQQAAQEEAYRRSLQAVQEQSARRLEVVQQHSARQMADVAAYFQALQIPGMTLPPLPPSLFAPPPPPSPHPTSPQPQSAGSNPTPTGGPSPQYPPPGAVPPQQGYSRWTGGPQLPPQGWTFQGAPPQPGYSSWPGQHGPGSSSHSGGGETS